MRTTKGREAAGDATGEGVVRRVLFDPALWFWVPLGLALVGGLGITLARTRILVAGLGFTSISLVVLGILATAFWSWFFKDGLGPGFIPSSGVSAWVRFWDGFSLPLAIPVIEALGIAILWRRRLSALRSLPLTRP